MMGTSSPKSRRPITAGRRWVVRVMGIVTWHMAMTDMKPLWPFHWPKLSV